MDYRRKGEDASNGGANVSKITNNAVQQNETYQVRPSDVYWSSTLMVKQMRPALVTTAAKDRNWKIDIQVPMS